jgi:hypothetical protein
MPYSFALQVVFEKMGGSNDTTLELLVAMRDGHKIWLFQAKSIGMCRCDTAMTYETNMIPRPSCFVFKF